MCVCVYAGEGVSEREEAAAVSEVSPAGLQAAGGGDDGPRAGLPAHEGLQEHDSGKTRPSVT